jgi:hypothetical protein
MTGAMVDALIPGCYTSCSTSLNDICCCFNLLNLK